MTANARRSLLSGQQNDDAVNPIHLETRSRSIPAVAKNAKIDISTVVAASPGRVVRAFFDAGALGVWWQATCSITCRAPWGLT